MSDSNRTSLAYVAESTYGVTPSGPPALRNLRMTGETLAVETNVIQSQELRSDRKIADYIRSNFRAAGDMNFELSYGSYDAFFQYLLCSAAHSSAVTNTQSTTATASTNVLAGTGVGTGLAVGDFIRTSGFSAAANNGIFKLTAAAANSITVFPTGVIVDEGAGSRTVKGGGVIKDGTTFQSMTIERTYGDLSSQFAELRGMAIDRCRFQTSAEALLTGAFGFIGKNETSATATVGDGANVAVTTNPVYSAVNNVVRLIDDTGSYPVTALSFEMSNNIRSRIQVGTLGPISLGLGTVNIRGTHQAYYNDSVAIDKYLSAENTSFAICISETATTNSLIFSFPRIRYSAGRRSAGGINTDVIADMAWNAFLDPTDACTIRIQRIP